MSTTLSVAADEFIQSTIEGYQMICDEETMNYSERVEFYEILIEELGFNVPEEEPYYWDEDQYGPWGN